MLIPNAPREDEIVKDNVHEYLYRLIPRSLLVSFSPKIVWRSYIHITKIISLHIKQKERHNYSNDSKFHLKNYIHTRPSLETYLQVG